MRRQAYAITVVADVLVPNRRQVKNNMLFGNTYNVTWNTSRKIYRIAALITNYIQVILGGRQTANLFVTAGFVFSWG